MYKSNSSVYPQHLISYVETQHFAYQTADKERTQKHLISYVETQHFASQTADKERTQRKATGKAQKKPRKKTTERNHRKKPQKKTAEKNRRERQETQNVASLRKGTEWIGMMVGQSMFRLVCENLLVTRNDLIYNLFQSLSST